MGISPATLRRLTERVVARAAPAYLMAVAGNADPMLGYLTTSFREHPRLRHQSDRQVTSAMASRLSTLGVNPTQTDGRSTSTAQLYAAFRKASGSTSSLTALVADGEHKLHELREQGYELGAPDSDTGVAERAADDRVDQLYSHARLALYATLDVSVLSGALDRHVRVRTLAADRDDYLAHPPQGEQLRLEDVALVERLYPSDSAPQLQFVISDGLNANAINEQLPALLPSVRQLLTRAGVTIGGIDVLVENGRVRAGYHVGQLVSATALVHFIGERPGTGLNSMSAYLTYGRDSAGVSRWSHALDHSCTAAVCGIHPRGKPPEIASEEIARAVLHMLKSKQSGVAVRRH
jgi:ethanolamine ammonia-lyase large subunit